MPDLSEYQEITDHTAWRAGDWAVIEWPDGSRAEGPLEKHVDAEPSWEAAAWLVLSLCGRSLLVRLANGKPNREGRTVRVYRKRPSSPQWLADAIKNEDGWTREAADEIADAIWPTIEREMAEYGLRHDADTRSKVQQAMEDRIGYGSATLVLESLERAGILFRERA